MSKVWFITGAASDIGVGTAKGALKAGDRVVATGRNVQKVRDALREVASDDLHVLPLDVSDEAQVTMAVDQAVKKFGRIAVVLNTAGYSLLGNFEELGTRTSNASSRPTSGVCCT
jgi:NAD(P)-dependent dehydrogenase (short-subunit alcohol dehydrogenase family)